MSSPCHKLNEICQLQQDEEEGELADTHNQEKRVEWASGTGVPRDSNYIIIIYSLLKICSFYIGFPLFYYKQASSAKTAQALISLAWEPWKTELLSVYKLLGRISAGAAGVSGPPPLDSSTVVRWVGKMSRPGPRAQL